MAQAQNDMTGRYDKDPQHIKDDIDHTRAEMDDTLNQLGDRLNPRHAINDLLAYFRTDGGEMDKEKIAASLKSGASATGHQIMQHPVPAALITAGLGYLVYELTQGRRHVSRENLPTEEGTYGGSYVDARTGQPYTDEYGSEFSGHHEEGWKGKAKGKLGQAREKVAGAAASMKGAATSAKERLMGAQHKMRDQTGMAGERMQQGMNYGKTQLRDAWEQRPVTVAAVAVGLGLLIGWSLPAMRKRY